jgi:hypothetical protein
MLPILSFLILFPSAVCAQESDTSEHNPWSVKQLVEFHLSIKENLGVQDIYKMLYQANFGVEHLLDDSTEVRSYLLRELASMESTTTDQLIERISVHDDVVRINLRPFKKQNLDPDMLVRAMYVSAAGTQVDTFQFVRQWNIFTDLVRYGLLFFPMDEVQKLSSKIEGGEITPLHHSNEYAKANRPAYRVVKRSVFEKLLTANL